MDLPVKYSTLNWKKGEKAIVREQYIIEQNNLCYYCNQNLNSQPPKKITDKSINWRLFPDNFLRYPIHLQHNHNTDMTEGAIHAYCNAVLWQYENR